MHLLLLICAIQMTRLQAQIGQEYWLSYERDEIACQEQRVNECFQQLIGRLKGVDFNKTDQVYHSQKAKPSISRIGAYQKEKKLDFCFELKQEIKLFSGLKLLIVVKEQLSLYPHQRQTSLIFKMENAMNIIRCNRSKLLMLLHFINKINSKIKIGKFSFNILNGNLKYIYSQTFSLHYFIKAVPSNTFMVNANQQAQVLFENIREQFEKILKACDVLPNSLIKYKELQNLRQLVFQKNKKESQSLEKENIESFMKGLVEKKSKTSRLGSSICSKIELQEQLPWRMYCQSGFSKLYVAQAKVKFLNFQDQYPKKTEYVKTVAIVKKTGLSNLFLSDSRIQHQKLIISSLKKLQHPGILRFFISQQIQYKDSLLMEYMSNRSLELFSSSNQQTLTIRGKLYLLCQIVQSLLFLKSEQITHLDIKPANILISRFLQTKLTDFGQSYRPHIIPKNHQPGFSRPYAAPEVFQQKIHFTSELDVFSFGVLMMELLFRRYPFQLRSSSQKYVSSCKNRTYWEKIFVNYEELRDYVNPEISEILIQLIFRCLQPEAESRFSFDQIRIVLKGCFNIISDIY